MPQGNLSQIRVGLSQLESLGFEKYPTHLESWFSDNIDKSSSILSKSISIVYKKHYSFQYVRDLEDLLPLMEDQ